MIGRDTSLTESEREFLADTIDTLENEVFVDQLGQSHFTELDDNEETKSDWREVMRRAGEHDLLGVAVPESHNGAGRGFIETVLVEQAIGYVGCIIHACEISLTQHVGCTMYRHGNDTIKEEYLKPLLNGERIIAQAFSEPTVGTDLTRLETTATRSGDEWVLNGEKRFIDFAGYADFLLVPARTSGTSGDRDGVSLFVVDADTAGYEIYEHHSPTWHGFRGSDACWIGFEDVAIPAANIIGEEGAAWDYITDELNLEHLTVARYCLGASQRAFEIAANYIQHREVNDKPVSRYQAINHLVAECATKLDASYLLNTRAARLLDDGGISAGRMEGAMAKWYGADVAHEIADACIQMMGGIATTRHYPVERIQRDVRAGRFLGGTSEVMKSIVQHDVLNQVADESFRGEYVGAELEGSPWREEATPPGSVADDD